MGESFQNCILYKSSEFKVDVVPLSNNIAAINNLKTHEGIEQKDRYLNLKLTNKKSLESVNITNVHLKWHSGPDAIINALNSYLTNCSGLCIIIGDFNQNISNSNTPLEKATQFVYEKGSISSTTDKKRKENTTDAIVYKLGHI